MLRVWRGKGRGGGRGEEVHGDQFAFLRDWMGKLSPSRFCVDQIHVHVYSFYFLLLLMPHGLLVFLFNSLLKWCGRNVLMI